MSRAGYDDIRIADSDMRCGSCGGDIETGDEYASNDSGMLICDACLTAIEDDESSR